MALRPRRIAGADRKDGKLIPIEEGEAVPKPKPEEKATT